MPRLSTEQQGAPPWHRRAPVWTAAAVLLISTVTFFRVPLLPEMGETLAMNATLLGVVTGLFAVGRLVVDLPAGALLDRIGPRPMFVLAGGLLFASSTLIGLAWTPGAVFAGAIVLGIASAAGNTTGQTFFARNVENERRGRSMAVFSASLLGGQTLGPALAGLAAALGGWRIAMLGGAGLGLLVVAGGWAAARYRVRKPDLPPTEQQPAATEEPANDSSEKQPDTDAEVAFGIGQRAALYGARFSGLFLMGAIPQTLIPIIGAENLSLGVGLIGAASGVGGVARFVAAFGGGQLADRLPRKVVMVTGLCVQIGGVLLLAVQGAVWAWVAAIVLISLGSFAMMTGTTILGDHVSDHRAGKELGAYRFIGDFGLLAGPAVGAVLFDVAGQRVAVISVAGLLVVSAVAAGLLLPEDPHRERTGA